MAVYLNQYRFAVLLLGIALGLGAAVRPVQAAEYELDLHAAAGSKWYEYFSDAFYELGHDRTDGGVPAGADGAWIITDYQVDGTYTPLGGGDVAFPTNFFDNIGTITYDTAGLTGSGSESATITDLAIDFDQYIAVRSVGGTSINISESPYSASFNSIVGTLNFIDGEVSSADLNANVTLTYASPFGPLPYAGTFSITGNQFSLQVDDTNNVSGFGDFRYVWDITGVAAVPEPASVLLLGMGVCAAVGMRRRRS